VGTRRTGRDTETELVCPDQCPNGHQLGLGRVRVSFLPCWCAPPGHHLFVCRECGATLYVPPHDGRAARMASLYDTDSG